MTLGAFVIGLSQISSILSTSPKGPRKPEPILGTAILGKKKLQPNEWESGLSANNARLVSVDLTGEKNQFILEFDIISVACF